MTDHDIKRERLLAILDRHDAEAIVLSSTGALAWYLEGARVHISVAGDPVLIAVVRRDGDEVITFGNEVDRLVAEELPAWATVTVRRWDAPFDAPAGPGVLTEAAIELELRAARASLLPEETARYEALCVEGATILTHVLSEARPSDTERQVTARIAHRIVDAGADAVVLLAAGRSRLGHRHPLATDAPVGDRAMFVICARRDGFIANVTRWVRFGSPRPDEADATSRVLEVEAAFLAASVVGARVSDAFDAGIAAYAAQGFAADEWTKHHQGGPCGYNGRDPRASASTPDVIALNQAFAWNPSAPGAKVEDTVLLTATGIRALSVDERWPTTVVHGLARPAELQL
jgi:Xaa-Pro aminopeptidase